MNRCNRCDFKAEDDEAAEEHARETGHWRCIVCKRRSLTVFESQTCGQCVGAVRADLADIVSSYAEIDPSGTFKLTLLGDGSMQRLFRQDETDSYNASAHPLAHGEGKPKPIRDELLSDPLPVVPALASWEDFIREHYPEVGKGGPDPTLSEIVDWFNANLDTRLDLAQTYPAFDEFAADIRRHRLALQRSAGLADDPVRAPATCPECDTQLVRFYNPPTDDRKHGNVRKGTDSEGLNDDWRCPTCGETVGRADYGFRVLLTSQSVEWAPIALAAAVVDKPVGLLRVWASRGHVQTRSERGRTEVWLPDVRDRISKAS